MLVGRYNAFGHDLNDAYIERARASTPRGTFTHGRADEVPYPDGYFDGVVLLDVLEHVQDERAVVGEIERVLRPGGRLIVSVPNRGALHSWDSLNVYARLLGSRGAPPTDDPSWPLSPHHRHYRLSDLVALFGDRFALRTVQYTGIGIAEPVNLALLLLFRALLPLPRVYNALQYLYFGVYLAEDFIRMGPWGYHMMVVLDRR
jgi:ubiquinone/menaquinone biosynthesis C-methylase UbiE